MRLLDAPCRWCEAVRYTPQCEIGRHQPLGRPLGQGPAAMEEIPPFAAMGASDDPYRTFRVPYQPAEGEREAGGEGDDGDAVVVDVHGGDGAPTVWQIVNGGYTAPWRVVIMFVVWDVNRGVRLLDWQRPCWCAPGGAGWWCRRILVAEDVQPLNVRAVRGVIVPDILLNQGAQCVEWDVVGLCFAWRRSCAEWMRPSAKWADMKVRDARAANQVQLPGAAADEVMPKERSAVLVVHLPADSAQVSRPQMWSFTFGHPEERYCSRDARVTIWECARFGAVRCGGWCGGSSPVVVAGRGFVVYLLGCAYW